MVNAIPIYDLFCPECGHTEIDMILSINEDLPDCSKCQTSMKRVCGCKSFKLVYNNKTDMCAWGNEGYARSQYWDQYKKDKADGKDVRIPKMDGE